MAKKLCVKLFGVFSASYGDAVLTFGRQTDSKFSQLFQLLMTRPGQGFSKKSVEEILYGCTEVENANASLNNTIFRLRKYLKSSPLPPGEYLTLSDGVLCFGGDVEVESDAWSFACAAHAFENEPDRQKKMDICRGACGLYQGEFLPQLSNEIWVIEQSRAYHEMYSQMLDGLLHYLKEEGDYRSIEGLAAHAAEIYPGEGWESWRIECLIVLGRYKEAEQVYQAAAAYAQEAGCFHSKEEQMKFNKMGAWIQRPEGTAEDIGRCLMERKPWEGAYNCTLPGFSDCFHMLKRIAARDGAVCFILLLCTVLDSGGHPANAPEYCKNRGEKLRATFKAYLRRGDVYTKYSDNQYLLLCVGADKGSAFDIGRRIDTDFRKRCGGRGGISFCLLDDGSMW